MLAFNNYDSHASLQEWYENFITAARMNSLYTIKVKSNQVSFSPNIFCLVSFFKLFRFWSFWDRCDQKKKTSDKVTTIIHLSEASGSLWPATNTPSLRMSVLFNCIFTRLVQYCPTCTVMWCNCEKYNWTKQLNLLSNKATFINYL